MGASSQGFCRGKWIAAAAASSQLSEHRRIAKRGPDPPRQFLATIRFTYDWEFARHGHSAGRISRHQEDRQAGTQYARPARELEPVDAAGHHDITHQQLDAAMSVDELQCFRSIPGG